MSCLCKLAKQTAGQADSWTSRQLVVWTDDRPAMPFVSGKQWTLCANFSMQFFNSCHGYRHHWCLPIYSTFSDPNLPVCCPVWFRFHACFGILTCLVSCLIQVSCLLWNTYLSGVLSDSGFMPVVEYVPVCCPVWQFTSLLGNTYLSGVLSDSGFMPVVEYLPVWCPVWFRFHACCGILTCLLSCLTVFIPVREYLPVCCPQPAVLCTQANLAVQGYPRQRRWARPTWISNGTNLAMMEATKSQVL